MVSELLYKLRKQNIILKVKGNETLEVVSTGGKISSDLLAEVKKSKQDLIDHFKNSGNYYPKKIQPAKLSDSYVVSSAQRSLWMECQNEKASISYNIPSYKVLDGISSRYFLEKAVNAVVDRHEILRTVFRQDDFGDLRQFVFNRTTIKFKSSYFDFRKEEDRESKIFSFIDDDSKKPFDFENGPLLRVAIFQVENEKFYLYFNIHHIISDAWSNDVLEKEVFKFYQFFVSQTPPDLPDLKIQYKDYSVWENDILKSEQIEKHKNYWLDKMSGELPRINLPTNKARPKFQTFNGQQLQAFIPSDEVDLLKKITQKEGGGLFMAVLSLMKIALFKYTNEKDLIVGCPFANRDEFELQNQMGYYVRPLLIRSNLDPEDNFKQLYQKVKGNVLSAFNHKDYPFSNLVKDLNLDYDPARSAIYDVSLTFHNSSLNTGFGEEIDFVEIIDRGSIKCKHDLEIHFQEVMGHLSFAVIFNSDVYELDMISQFMQHFKQILSDVVNNPNRSINELDYLNFDEKHTLLNNFNNTLVEYSKDKTIIDLFEEQVLRRPNEVAIVSGETKLTYQDLNDQVNQLANCLKEKYNLKRNDLVGIKLGRGEQMVISILGIIKAQGAYVPMDIHYADSRIDYIMKNGDLKLCIDDIWFQNFVEEKEKYASGNLGLEITGDDLVYCIYTSGSSGKPKGVLNLHKGLFNRLVWMQEYLEADHTEVYLQKTPYTFDVSVWELILPFTSGAKLVIARDEGHKDVSYLKSVIQQNKVSTIHFVPSMLNVFLYDLEKGECSTLKNVICSGEKLPVITAQDCKSKIPNGALHNLYGPTEASIDVTAINLSEVDVLKEGVSIGKPVANTKIYIVNDALKLQPIGVKGELLISGIQVAKGYLNLPDLNNEKFIEDPFRAGYRAYKTGDIVQWNKDGSIRYIGRRDNQVKIRGNRIELGEIETCLSNFDGINQAVVDVKEENGNKYLVAYFVTEENLDKNEIQSEMMGKLPDYMVPGYFVQLKSMPLNANGKIDRKSLPSVTGKDLIKTEYIAPNTTEEKILALMWSDILKFDKIGIKDNFFNLGGESIKSILLISSLKKKGYNLKLEDLLKHPRLEDFAKIMEENFFKGQNTDQEDHSSDLESIRLLNNELLNKEWAVGDMIELSPNQKRYYKDKRSIAAFNFRGPIMDTSVFEKGIRGFLSQFPCLTTNFENVDGKVFQKYISASDIKIEFLTKEIDEQTTVDAYEKGYQFLYFNPFDLIDGELIRVLVLKDKENNESRIKVSLHHSLVDFYTANVIEKNAENYFKGIPISKDYYHPFKLYAHQQVFLKSKEALSERKYWTDLLDTKQLSNNENRNKDEVEGVSQSVFISGDSFKAIQRFSKKSDLSISMLVHAFYSILLNQIGFENKKLYHAYISGREKYIEGLERDRIIGAMDNVIIKDYSEDNVTWDIDVLKIFYSNYLDERMNLNIPYETIREDFKEKSGIDIDANTMGYINYRILEKNIPYAVSDLQVKIEDSMFYDFFEMNCLSDLYKDGVSIEIVCRKDLFDANKDSILLENHLNQFMQFVSEV